MFARTRAAHRKIPWRVLWLAASLCSLLPTAALAQAADDEGAPQTGSELVPGPRAPPAADLIPESFGPAVPTIHGFISQGFLLSSANDYLARSSRGSFEFTEAALNFNWTLSDRLRAGIQLFTRDLGPLGNYTTRFDWFFLDWRQTDWVGVRAGRIRLPFGLYNSTSDYDPGRTPILLPQAVYPLAQRDFLLALTGLELYGLVPLGPAGDLDYRVFVGTSFFDETTTQLEATVEVPYTAGGRLMWETPLDGLRVGGSALTTRLDADLTLGEAPLAIELDAILWIASLEYALGALLVAAEYGRWHLMIEGLDPALFPDVTLDPTSERFYLSAHYGLTPWLSAGAYYAGLFIDVEDRTSGSDQFQHDVALSARMDLHPNWLLKLEAHGLYGTAALDDSLNGQPNDQAIDLWGLLVVKTTVYF